MRGYTCIFFLFSALFSYGQEINKHLIDSLEQHNPDGLDSLYYNFFVKYMQDDPDKAASYAMDSYRLAKKSNDVPYIIKSGNALGYFSNINSNYTEAERYFTEAIDLSIKNGIDDRLIYLYNNIGLVYTNTSQYDKAIENYLNLLKIAIKQDNFNYQGIAYNNIGLVYYKINSINEALNYFLNALKIRNENNITHGIYVNYLNLGLCYNALGNFQEANNAFRVVLENQDKIDQKTLADTFFGLGRTYFNMGLFDETIKYLHNAKNLDIIHDEPILNSSIEYYLARIYYHRDEIEKALVHLDLSQNLARQMNSWERLENNYALYADIYEKQTDYRQAYQSLKYFVSYKDSLFNEQMADKFKDAHIAFQQGFSDDIIQDKDVQIKKNRQFNYLLGISLTLAVFFVIFAVRVAAYRRKINRQLDSLVKKKTKELSTTNRKLVKSKKELDTFLYKTSHDIRGPIATLMGLTNLTILENKNKNIAGYLKELDNTANNLNEVISRLTTISQINSQPFNIEKIHTISFMEDIILRFRRKYQISNTITFNNNLPEHIYSDKILLIYIIENLIDNSFKFMDHLEHEPRIRINLTMGEKLMIEIEDNGIGIPPAFTLKIFDIFFVANEKTRGSGIGLYQAMMAAERLNGTIQVKNPAKPTVMRVVLNYL
ncbi:MAG: tetratricopeptide repeat-containing sensor histidine kinase [Cyclobacteriaceae bacterium]|nr:tetratricopeptide repeat-containing sensor histidine kinase [Cyclobacteriaceae bacterium]